MTGPAPHPSTYVLPPVAVETVNAGDLLLLGGVWLTVQGATPDGPRVTVRVPDRDLRYWRGELVTVFRPVPQQMANPAFLATLGPAVFTSSLVDRFFDWIGWRRPRT
ncbi:MULTISPECIES: hypothetical protein [unclassified Micromonospora]|uniref:hypothetical protein n=1 Tax=unclassified Micromonospora TaxID=2617518 RepID=UPI00332A5492